MALGCPRPSARNCSSRSSATENKMELALDLPSARRFSRFMAGTPAWRVPELVGPFSNLLFPSSFSRMGVCPTELPDGNAISKSRHPTEVHSACDNSLFVDTECLRCNRDVHDEFLGGRAGWRHGFFTIPGRITRR